MFSLGTHRALFAGREAGPEGGAGSALERGPGRPRARRRDGVHRVDERDPGGRARADGEKFGLDDIFVGVFVVAILGNAAEQATAIIAATKDRMDLSLSIAIGASVQVALFVAPISRARSHAIAPTPMDLAFPGGLVLTALLAVPVTVQVAGDGRSNWLKAPSCWPSTWSLA